MKDSTTAIQRTLTGEPTETTRTVPNTMIYCEECDDLVLRSERHDHPHDLDERESGIDPKTKKAKDKVPEHAILDTQTYEITFHYEYVETVRVEATNKGDAVTEAEHVRDFDARYIETIHTEKRELDEPGQATIEYLEEHNLLPDDHDVTPADLQRVIDS